MKKLILFFLIIIGLGATYIVYARCGKDVTRVVQSRQRLREKAREAKAYCEKKGFNMNYCFLVDFSIHSGKKPILLWIYE